MSRKEPKTASVTPKQARYVAYLLEGHCKQEAARLAGISPRRARAWHHQQAFQEFLSRQVDVVLQEVLSRIVALLPDATRAFADALKEGEPHQRASVAARLVDVLLRLRTDFDLAQRIERLENEIAYQEVKE